jgi:hypothetical protein
VTANQVSDDADAESVRAAFPDHEPVLVPDDPAILDAERRGRALVQLTDMLTSDG